MPPSQPIEDSTDSGQAPQSSARPLRVPPHSIDAEQAVLGSLLLNEDAWLEVLNQLTAEDFYRLEHRLIYESLKTCWDRNDRQPTDALTLSETMAASGQLQRVGGLAYLTELVDNTPSGANAAAYARIVQDHSTRRQVIRASQKIAETGFNPDGRTGDEVLDYAESEVYAIADQRLERDGPVRLDERLNEAVEAVRQAKSLGRIPGLSSGFGELDDKTKGFKDSDLIIIAGRPSMGKTALALNIVEHALMGEADNPKPCLVFSLEMATEQLVLRLLSSLAGLDQSRMQTGDLDARDWDKFIGAVTQLQDKPLWIDDTPALTPSDLRARVRRVAREAAANGGPRLGLIVVDYLQLMRGGGKVENRTNEISEISRALKALAKEMRCPLIALSQLNRDVEKRANKRPMMADLRDSGAIEQDADLILFIYRHEVYEPNDEEHQGKAEVNIGKQRNGVTGMIELAFRGNLTRFSNLEAEDYSDVGEH